MHDPLPLLVEVLLALSPTDKARLIAMLSAGFPAPSDHGEQG
jgi:hypothetical protein